MSLCKGVRWFIMRHLYLIMFTLILCVSCSQNEAEPRNKTQQQTNVEPINHQDNHTLSNEQIASHLATIATKVPNVNDAAAIVAGPYAVVGIDIDEMTKSERVGTTKYSVGEALQHDPYGRTAVVIADADMMTRIREMGNNLREGHPVQGIVDELADIVGRYMPISPVDDNIQRENEADQAPLPESEVRDDEEQHSIRK